MKREEDSITIILRLISHFLVKCFKKLPSCFFLRFLGDVEAIVCRNLKNCFPFCKDEAFGYTHWEII